MPIPTHPEPAGLGTACAVVLAGGAARRFGADKTAARLGPSTVLEHVLAGLPPDLPVVVVGPRRPLGRAAPHWTLEVPPGGGPAAALAAGCAAAPAGTDRILAVAGDQPYSGAAAVRLLAVVAGSGQDAAVGVESGRRQPLLAAYRLPALLAALGPAPAGRSMRDVLSPLTVVEVPLSALEVLDVDTPADLERAVALLPDAHHSGE